jgi:hypothetical protein
MPGCGALVVRTLAHPAAHPRPYERGSFAKIASVKKPLLAPDGSASWRVCCGVSPPPPCFMVCLYGDWCAACRCQLVMLRKRMASATSFAEWAEAAFKYDAIKV